MTETKPIHYRREDDVGVGRPLCGLYDRGLTEMTPHAANVSCGECRRLME